MTTKTTRQTTTHRFFHVGALCGLMALGGIAGCGEGMPDPTESAAYALTGHVAGPYGNTGGTWSGTGSDQLTPVTKITGYATTSYIYGIRLHWGTTSKLWGETHNLDPQVFVVDGDPVYKVGFATLDQKLRAIEFTNQSGNLYLGLTATLTTAFDDEEAVFTDLQAGTGQISGGSTVIWGAKFHYTTP